MILKRNFYNQNTVKVAQNLLGCYLIRQYQGKIIKTMITETEAYRGQYDLASHASKGRTSRNEIMFGQSGCAYVYFVYGMHFMFNIVTEKKGYPAAVLIRGVEIQSSSVPSERLLLKKRERILDGPGKLTKYLYITKSLNGLDLTKKTKLWVESVPHSLKFKRKIVKSPRIGVSYARHCQKWKWNFKLTELNS